MSVVSLSRWQFAITTVYHFFFVPLTLGLAIFVALLETQYVRSGDEKYKHLTKFWGKLFLINFAMGVVTGLVQEFQFGLNWSEYSRFMGDIFGAPLAIEALLAFYMESTFIGVWLFGWEKLSKKAHLASAWLVAIGSNLSALWILIANSFMQQPVGYTPVTDAAGNIVKVQMSNFLAVATNPNVRVQFPHVFFAAITTAGFFVLAVAAWHLLRDTKPIDHYQTSFRWGVVYAVIGAVMVILVGHTQAQHMVEVQPMKMAAAEAVWTTEDPAGLSLFSWIDVKNQRNTVDIRVPYLLSILAYNKPSGAVRGMKELQAEYEQKYGPGNYIPPVPINYWSFRIMVGAGFLMAFLALVGLYYVVKGRTSYHSAFLRALTWAFVLPYLANSTGWILTEVGRQPWIVFGLQKTSEAVSPNVTPGMVWFSLLLFLVLYGALMVADVYLLLKYARAGVEHEGAATAAMAY